MDSAMEECTIPPLKVSLKPFLLGLKYAYLDVEHNCPVIVNNALDDPSLEKLLVLLRKYKGVIRYSINDIKGINPSLGMYRTHLNDDLFTSIKPQRRLNPNMKEVVKTEILKLLKAGIIYSISDSRWVNPIHAVSKKGGMTIIQGESGEMIPSRTTTSWRVCIGYRKLNKATRMVHFPLPFIN